VSGMCKKHHDEYHKTTLREPLPRGAAAMGGSDGLCIIIDSARRLEGAALLGLRGEAASRRDPPQWHSAAGEVVVMGGGGAGGGGRHQRGLSLFAETHVVESIINGRRRDDVVIVGQQQRQQGIVVETNNNNAGGGGPIVRSLSHNDMGVAAAAVAAAGLEAASPVLPPPEKIRDGDVIGGGPSKGKHRRGLSLFSDVAVADSIIRNKIVIN